MKLLFTCLLVFFAGIAGNNHDYYIPQMKDALMAQEQADNAADYLKNAQQFEILVAHYDSKWEPAFHAAFSYIRLSFKEKGNSDVQEVYLEKAKTLLEYAKERGMGNDSKENESEYKALMAYWYQAYISISPKTRGIRYVSTAKELMKESIDLNPNNPRPYLLKGMLLLFTPRIMGGGASKGCPYLKQSKDKFASFEPSSSIAPNWGYDDILLYWPECE